MSDELEHAGYGEVLARLTAEVRAAQVQAQRTANVALLRLYWTIGSEILHQQQTRGWGSKVIDRLAVDLRAEFPSFGLSANAERTYVQLNRTSVCHDAHI